jgi:predicted dehydrogenase
LVSDLLVHPLTKMMAAMGLDFPSRVSASGGLYLERDGRDAPDLVSAIVEYADRGCQLLLSTSAISNYPIEEVIRGRDGAIRFQPKGIELFRDQAAPETISIEKPRDNTRALWLNFLDCIRTENRKTLSPPDLAAAVSTTLAMISQSQRTGRSLGWDREIREAIIDN